MINYIKTIGTEDESEALNNLKSIFFKDGYGEENHFSQVAIRNKAFDALEIVSSEIIDENLMTQDTLKAFKNRKDSDFNG